MTPQRVGFTIVMFTRTRHRRAIPRHHPLGGIILEIPMTRRLLALAVGVHGTLAPLASAAPATFAEFELPPGNWTSLETIDLSGDGRVVAGNLFDASNMPHAFRWTRTGGYQIAPVRFRASTISRDGSAILGSRTTPDSSGSFMGFAVRWTSDAITDFLGPSARTIWNPTATNTDGTIAALTGFVVGPITTTRVGRIWTAQPPVNLIQPANDWTVYDLADDASVFVGQSAPSSIFGGDPRLYRPYWRNFLGTSLSDIPAPPGPTPRAKPPSSPATAPRSSDASPKETPSNPGVPSSGPTPAARSSSPAP